MQDDQSFQPVNPDVINELLLSTVMNLGGAMERAEMGISSRTHYLDQTVTFILDNQQEVRLRVRQIEIEHAWGEALSLQVHCRTDFENVLILAKKLNMRIAAFATWFTVILTASSDFLETWSEAILDMDHPAKFFETLDSLKRPIFLNLNNYIISRISD